MDKLSIVELSEIGRITIKTLDLNRARVMLIRAADLEVNRHPPEGDLIQNQ